MIVYDLSCDAGHRFEGWFGSSTEFAEQQEAGLVICPQCGSAAVTKAPMAPAIARKGNQQPGEPKRDNPSAESAPKPVAGGKLPSEIASAMRALAEIQAKALNTSEYVGDRFAEEARAIHYGEREDATIHGKANETERQELLDEGIVVAPLLAPFTPPEDIN